MQDLKQLYRSEQLLVDDVLDLLLSNAEGESLTDKDVDALAQLSARLDVIRDLIERHPLSHERASAAIH